MKTNSIKKFLSPGEYALWSKLRKRARDRAYYHSNLEKAREKRCEYSKTQYKTHKHKIQARNKKWYLNNSSKAKEYSSNWIKTNREKVNSRNLSYHQRRMESDPLYVVKFKLRGLIGAAVRRIKQNKPTNAETLLGCSWEQAKAHIEGLWQEGMSWDNHGNGPGTWQIDHIRPVSDFKEHEVHLMNLIHNLQPLWHEDHVIKHTAITCELDTCQSVRS